MFGIDLQYTSAGKPFIIIDNFLTDDDQATALMELDQIIRPSMRREGTGEAVKDEVSVKKANACFINDIYIDQFISPTFRLLRNYFTEDFFRLIAESHWAYEWLLRVGFSESTQFLYYDEQDSYDAHPDQADMSALLWLAKEPRGFSGGDLIIEGEQTVEFKHNRMVIFSLGTLHQVTKVHKTLNLDGHGRYCISNFFKGDL